MEIKKIIKKIKPFLGLIFLFVVSLVYIFDPRFFSNPPLRSDDWNMLIEPTIFGSFDIVDIANRRPFMLALYAVVSPIFELNISLYYVVNWLLIFTSGVVFYFIVRSVFARYRWLALPSALIFLIYPVNYARTWLVIQINTFALLLTLLAVLLLVRYLESGKGWKLILSNILIIISFGTYEAGLGIVLMASLLVLFFYKKVPRKRRLWAQTTILVSVIFILWRTFIQPAFLDVSDQYLANTSFNIPTILERYVQGAFIFLFNWVGPIFIRFGSYKYWVFLGAFAFGIFLFILVAWTKIRNLLVSESEEDKLRKNNIKELFSIGGLGLLVWAAGYIPVIFLWQPIFYGDGSRVNFAAIPGASIALVAFISALVMILVADKKKAEPQKYLTWIIVPLVVLGMVYQIFNQNIRFKIWHQLEGFWNQMFVLAPEVEPGTKMVVVIPGYDDLVPFEMTPLRGDWEAESAFKVLYNTEILFAEYYYVDIPDYVDNWQATECDLERFVFVYYDPESGETRIIEDPNVIFDFPCSISFYDPWARITDLSDNGIGEFRWLVGQGDQY